MGACLPKSEGKAGAAPAAAAVPAASGNSNPQRVAPSPHTKYSASFDSAAAERDYRQCLNAVTLDLMSRLCQVFAAHKQAFDRTALYGDLPQLERYVIDAVALPAANKQFANTVKDDLDRTVLLLNNAKQSEPRVDIEIERIIDRVTAIAAAVNAHIDQALVSSDLSSLRAGDVQNVLRLIQRGFVTVFKDLAPNNPHILYGNIDRYTQDG